MNPNETKIYRELGILADEAIANGDFEGAVTYLGESFQRLGHSSYRDLFELYQKTIESARTAKKRRNKKRFLGMAKELVETLARNRTNAINLQKIIEDVNDKEIKNE